MAICAIHGATKVEVNFAQSFFIPPDSDTEKFYLFDSKYFRTGFDTWVINLRDDIDYTSEETQLQLLNFWDKLRRCYLCDETWFNKYRYSSWYLKLNEWFASGSCSH